MACGHRYDLRIARSAGLLRRQVMGIEASQGLQLESQTGWAASMNAGNFSILATRLILVDRCVVKTF
jgi:hypothetical protein